MIERRSLRATGYRGIGPRAGQLFKAQRKPPPLGGINKGYVRSAGDPVAARPCAHGHARIADIAG